MADVTTVLAAYALVGTVTLTVMRITPGSIQRHYENVAVTDAETDELIRQHPYLCAASWAFMYLLGLALWPVVAASSTLRR
ncbi:hypothetical protein [Streptomyces sp. SID161]|uniref:hypothetical protein n=1 Tax=Streptomyces sp. SID161 TaxID=2690251 RepID=UPI00136D3E59|nr:hypothetical protein [Streptomyces sp. SID161]MYW46365.1 hypothetical protein [Streptomyces sp. SID161]